MPDVVEQLHSYADWIERDHPPVDPAALRALEEVATELAPLDDDSGGRRDGRRAARLVAAALVALVVVVGAIAIAHRPSVTSGPTASTSPGSTVAAPRPTQLPPVGDDPVVTCNPGTGQWFRRSALDGPKGAENATDGPAVALKKSIDLAALANRVAGGPLVPGLPTSDWRRVAESPDRVLFEAGDLTGKLPLLSFTEVQKVGDDWQATSVGGGGTCNSLWVQPQDGGALVGFTVDRPDPSATSLHLRVSKLLPCGQSPSSAADLIGPDVIETDASVTIDVVARTTEPDVIHGCPLSTPPPTVDVDVPLQRPLGDRSIRNATVFPAAPAAFTPSDDPGTRTSPPRLVLGDGATEVRLDVMVDSGETCSLAQPDSCSLPTHPAHISLANGGRVAVGDTDSRGFLVAVVPDGLTTIEASGPDVACGRILVASTAAVGGGAIGCTRLDLPHADIAGRLTGLPATVTPIVTFNRVDNLGRSVTQVPEADGSFRVVLEPGEWKAIVQAVGGPMTGCAAQPAARFTVTDGPNPIPPLELTCRP
jgi:hypothetical protein